LKTRLKKTRQNKKIERVRDSIQSERALIARIGKYFLQVCPRKTVSKLSERSVVRDLFRRTHKSTPRGPRESPTDTDAPHAELSQF
jgi:hypothetical protein